MMNLQIFQSFRVKIICIATAVAAVALVVKLLFLRKRVSH